MSKVVDMQEWRENKMYAILLKFCQTREKLRATPEILLKSLRIVVEKRPETCGTAYIILKTLEIYDFDYYIDVVTHKDYPRLLNMLVKLKGNQHDPKPIS